jgi:hypothetical protein
MGERSLWLPQTLPQYIMNDNSLVSYSLAKAADNAESDPVSAYKRLMGVVNDAILKNMPEKMDVYPLAAQVIRKQGWEAPMREGVNKFFSPENRTPRGRDMAYLSGVVEKIGRFLGNAGVDQLTAPLDPLAAATYGGVNAKFPSKTGRFSNMADKMERFEISDKGVGFNPNVWGSYENSKHISQGTKLGDAINHPKLFEQYPKMADVPIFVSVDKSNTPSGSFTNAGNRWGISINARSMKEAKDTLIHEIQHAIQEKEGFARGGSPQKSGINIIQKQNLYQGLKDEAESIIKSGKANKGVYDQYNRAVAKLQELSDTDPMTNYQRLSGEIEARDAAARMNLTGQQRARTGPYTSENIPLSEWITRK